MQRNRAGKEEYEHFLAAVRAEFAGNLVVADYWVEVKGLFQGMQILDQNDFQSCVLRFSKDKN